MRAEIKAVATTIASMVNRVDNPGNPLCLSNTHKTPSGIAWSVSQSNYGHRSIHIVCYAADEDGTPIYNTRDHEMAVSDVQAVHESLEPFLVWAISNFPELSEQLKPIFAASES